MFFALNLIFILQVTSTELLYTIITEWRSAALIGLIVVLTAVDLAIVETGKADRWASAALDDYGFLSRHRNKLVIALIAITLINFMLSFQPDNGQ